MTKMGFEQALCYYHNLAGLFIPEKKEVVTFRLRMYHKMRFDNGEDLTKEEACIMIGCTPETIPKMKNSKRNYRLRRMLKLLTKDEHRQYMKSEAKQIKINRGAEKIYALLDRALEDKNVAAA